MRRMVNLSGKVLVPLGRAVGLKILERAGSVHCIEAKVVNLGIYPKPLFPHPSNQRMQLDLLFDPKNSENLIWRCTPVLF